MGIPTLILLTTASFCVMGQLTRDPRYGTTEGRVSCLEDTFMRLESYGTAMRKKMAVIEESNDSLQERIAALEAHRETEFRAAEERIEAVEAINSAQSEEINNLKSDNEELESQLREHAAINAAQSEEINSLKSENEDLESQLREHAAENAAQSDEINALKANDEEPHSQPRAHAVELSCNDTFDLISSSRHGVPDSSLTASSEWSGLPARASRLSSNTCWAANLNSPPPHWINVDLGRRRIVTAIRTSGNWGGFRVERFTLSTSRDGVNWSTIQENEEDVLFEGNDDVDTIVTNQLPVPIKTRFVRLNAVGWLGRRPGLRWAIDGCPVA